MELNLNEILRYAGFKGHAADEITLNNIAELEKEIKASVNPKCIYREFEFQKVGDSAILIDGIEFRSKKLVSHLKNSKSILLFAATLGVESDIILRKYSASDSAKYVLCQAIMAEAVEAYSNEILDALALKYEKDGLYFRPRFSAGYADLDLTAQKDFFNLLEITKRAGISLTDDCIMIPSKSVTAFIGITPDKECQKSACQLCDKTDCDFRRR